MAISLHQESFERDPVLVAKLGILCLGPTARRHRLDQQHLVECGSRISKATAKAPHGQEFVRPAEAQHGSE